MIIPQTEVIITANGVELGRHTVSPGEYVLGREGDISVEADLVSRRHARLTLTADHAFIEDLGSSNGTQVNGKPVTGHTRLWPNQKIQVGAATIELRRLRTDSDPGMTLAPMQEVLRRVLPEEFLREKKYDIGGIVARGGMGAILDAREATTERTVAMKVMLDATSPDDLLRFLNEAKITAQLEHPNIVPVHELNVDDNGQLFYTMKFVKGITLKKVLELIAEGIGATVKKYPLAVLLTVFQKVCDALAFAHSKGVIHRDLKPENIMIGDYGEVLVMDWGLAKRTGSAEGGTRKEEAGALAELSAFRAPSSALAPTLAGSVMGTPQFMAPEQARGEVDRIDARSDIYSLGAILYQILALRVPVNGRDAWDIVGKVGRGEIEPLTAPAKIGNAKAGALSHLPGGELPESLSAVIRKAMSLGRSGRYQTVPELQADIDAYQNGFATGAEKAGAWKQFTLFVKRHKAVATATAAAFVIVTAVVGVAFVRVTGEKNNATRALTRLRGTAPTFAAQAHALIEKQQFAEALEKIEFAIALQPDDADYLFVKGNLLQSLFRFEEARAAYTAALARKPDHAFANENAALCEAIIQTDAGRVPPGTASLTKLRTAMVRQSRPAEAVALLRVLGKDKKVILDTAKAVLAASRINATLEQADDGSLTLTVHDPNTESLAPLRGMPLNRLNISGTKVIDLSPLAGMPLDKIWMTNTQVTDLSPLKGMKLRHLTADGSRLADLSPLAGMPIETIEFRNAKVADLGPLHGMPLKSLILSGWLSEVRDLTPLAGLPLTNLDLQEAKVSDISPLKGMPLKRLILRSSYVRDLAPLAGMPLTELDIGVTQVRDLAPLRGMKLEAFSADRTPVSDLSPLDGMPLAHLGLISSAVRDLSPLKHSKIKTLDIRDTPATDISPLRGQPIETLLCYADRIPDLTPVQTMPLKRLWAINAKLSDLTFLKNVPLDELCLDGSTIADIRGLAGMPLRSLALTRTAVRDLTPLATCRKLEYLAFPPECKDVEFLRSFPSLQRIDTTWTTGAGVSKPAATFWKEHDAKKAAAPK